MRSSVLAYLPTFSKPLEGRLPFMYLDVLGKVTTGTGNLIDSISAAQNLLGLPAGGWKNKDGSQATPDQVAAEWQRVKALQDHSADGGNSAAFRNSWNLQLPDADITTLFDRTVSSFESVLKSYFPEWESWPADAQLAGMSLAWANGPYFPNPNLEHPWPKLVAALKAKDFYAAAKESHIDDSHNPGVTARNVADAQLFTNADVIQKGGGGDFDTLYYPRALAKPPSPNSPLWGWVVGALTLAGMGGLTWWFVKERR